MTIQAVLDDDSGTTDTASFTVDFIQNCATDVITYTSGVDATYNYDFETDIVITPVFTSQASCPLGAYTFTFIDQEDSTAYPELITFDSSTGQTTVSSEYSASLADKTY